MSARSPNMTEATQRGRRVRRRIAPGLVAVSVACCAWPASGAVDDLDLVTLTSAGAPADGTSQAPSISADGRFVAFVSEASNLAAEATASKNIYVRDLQAQTTTLVSRQSAADGGAGADDRSFDAAISADGRYVVFESDADNLSAEDAASGDVFVRDLQAQTTTLVEPPVGVRGRRRRRRQLVRSLDLGRRSRRRLRVHRGQPLDRRPLAPERPLRARPRRRHDRARESRDRPGGRGGRRLRVRLRALRRRSRRRLHLRRRQSLRRGRRRRRRLRARLRRGLDHPREPCGRAHRAGRGWERDRRRHLGRRALRRLPVGRGQPLGRRRRDGERHLRSRPLRRDDEAGEPGGGAGRPRRRRPLVRPLDHGRWALPGLRVRGRQHLLPGRRPQHGRLPPRPARAAPVGVAWRRRAGRRERCLQGPPAGSAPEPRRSRRHHADHGPAADQPAHRISC